MLESKRRSIIFFVLSVLLALTAGFLVMNKVRALNNNLGTMVKVYVASTDITSRTLITLDNVRIEEIPKKYLRDYHITDSNDLINKVSVVPLSKGDVITKNMLKQASSVLKENDRLITLMRSERVVFDEPLESLDRVDIIVSHQFNGKQETIIFMEDVKVARVAKKKNEFSGVQLEVPLEKAPELIHMQNYADSVRIVKANVGKKKDGSSIKKKEEDPQSKQESPQAQEANQQLPNENGETPKQ